MDLPAPSSVRRWLALLIAALSLLGGRPAIAFAPDHRWRTLETPHFVLHFHEGLYPLAVRSARSLERAHERLVPLFSTEPRQKTQVVLTDDTDDANGAAIAFERPRIWLQAAPPDDLSVLGDYDDYVFLLVAHEYVHVLQLGAVSGLPALLNLLFGDRWTPNGVLPRFFTEGLATYHESQVSAAGRNRSALFDMYLRADVLDDRLMPLSQVMSGGLRWPRGNAAYLYGGRFLAWLAETRGDEAIRAFILDYGDKLIPYSINLDLKRAAGADLPALWEEWGESLRLRYAAQEAIVRGRGPVTEPAIRSRFGDSTRAPRWSPDGRGIYYVEATAHRRPRLRFLERENGADRELAELDSAGTLAPLPDGGVLLARAEIHRVHRIHGELFAAGEDGEVQLTSGLRAAEPDLGPDGMVYFVEKRLGGTRLLRLALDAPDSEPELIYEPPPGRVIYTPRVSPDGSSVAISQSRGGPGRDILVVPADPRSGAPIRRLTDDDATDLDPAWLPDGSAVIASSDRDGIFNLYSIPMDPPGSGILRLTNVLTGAFQPDVSPDGEWIAWTTYGSMGWDIAAAPLASLFPTPAEIFTSDRPEPPGAAVETEELYPIRRYRPLETLGPQSWFPYLGADRSGTVVGAILGGGDAVGLHAWNLTAGWGIFSGQPEAAAAYRYAGWYLQPNLAAGTTFRSVPGFASGTTERAIVGSGGLELPIASLRRRQAVTLAYEATYFQPIHSVDGAPSPSPGLATELQLGWQFASAEQPSESISPENGVGLGVLGRWGSRALGGDYDYAAIDASASGYLRLPWFRHHVLVLSVRAGASEGDLGDRRLYGLGGPVLSDPLMDLLFTGRILGGGMLRGYAPVSFVGSRLVLGSAEYRFPIAWIDRSPGTLPLYASKLAGAVFAEAGDAFDGQSPRLHPSVGGELRLGVDVGWGYAGSIRLGWAWGLDVAEGGGSRPYLGAGVVF